MRIVVLAALLAVTPRAHACIYGGCEGIFIGATLGGSLAGIATLGILGSDLAHHLDGRALPDGLVAANFVAGAIDLAGGLALCALGTEAAIGLGLGIAGAGLIMLIEGIVGASLPRPRAPPAFGVEVSSQGAVATARWRF